MEKQLNLKKEITISKEKFLQKCAEVTAEEMKELKEGKTAAMLTYAIVSAEIARKLFDEENEQKETESPNECEDYKERLGREYWELTERLEKLLKYIDDIKTGRNKDFKGHVLILDDQASLMKRYLSILETRAVTENIELGKYKENK